MPYISLLPYVVITVLVYLPALTSLTVLALSAGLIAIADTISDS